MEFVFKNTENTRILFKKYLDELSLEEINKIPEGFNNNIYWNIAHAMVTQQVLLYKLSGLPIQLDIDLVDAYKKGTKPERIVTQLEVDTLKEMLFCTLTQVKKDYYDGKFKNFTPYTVSTNNSTLNTIEDALIFCDYHEGMHLGYVIAQKRAL